MDRVTVSVEQGEAKTLPFRIKDKNTGRPLDLTGATLLLWVKRDINDLAPIIIKTDSDFEKGGVESGYLSVFLEAVDTYQDPGKYCAELRIVKNGDPVPIEKLSFNLEITQAVTPNDWILAPSAIVSLEAMGQPVVELI